MQSRGGCRLDRWGSCCAGCGSRFGSELYQLHTLRPEDFEDTNLPDAWFHWFDFEPYLVEMREFLAQYGPWRRQLSPAGR